MDDIISDLWPIEWCHIWWMNDLKFIHILQGCKLSKCDFCIVLLVAEHHIRTKTLLIGQHHTETIVVYCYRNHSQHLLDYFSRCCRLLPNTNKLVKCNCAKWNGFVQKSHRWLANCYPFEWNLWHSELKQWQWHSKLKSGGIICCDI